LEGHAASIILKMEEANIYLPNYTVSHLEYMILILTAIQIRVVGV
jgi:hypothetical protein